MFCTRNRHTSGVSAAVGTSGHMCPTLWWRPAPSVLSGGSVTVPQSTVFLGADTVHLLCVCGNPNHECAFSFFLFFPPSPLTQNEFFTFTVGSKEMQTWASEMSLFVLFLTSKDQILQSRCKAMCRRKKQQNSSDEHTHTHTLRKMLFVLLNVTWVVSMGEKALLTMQMNIFLKTCCEVFDFCRRLENQETSSLGKTRIYTTTPTGFNILMWDRPSAAQCVSLSSFQCQLTPWM